MMDLRVACLQVAENPLCLMMEKNQEKNNK